MKSVLVTLGLLLATSCSMVGPQGQGIRVAFGEATSVNGPGVYLWIPFIMGMAKVDVSIQKTEIDTSAASKDMQEIKAKIAINWRMKTEDLLKTYIKIGDEEDMAHRVLSPAVNEVLKSVTAKKNVEEILAKRMELKTEIDEVLKARIAQYGADILDISIVNLAFSPDFEKAIEQKQIAEQAAKQAGYSAEKTKREAEARVYQAEGEAKAQQLLRVSINKDLIELKAIEKWNGVLPTYISGPMPFLNISK